jgi:peroxiredoxin
MRRRQRKEVPVQETAVPAIGQMAPDFMLKGPGGQFVTLSEYRGKQPVVLVFYPLAFSPVCSHQLPAIEKDLARFSASGAVVLGVSVDSHYANTAFADRLGLSFPLLSDWKREASAAYGVLIEASGHSGRALFLIDREGRIVHQEVAPTLSEIPDHEVLIRALAGLT